jgi:RNA polymerase sigma factor (sigma-70 family)
MPAHTAVPKRTIDSSNDAELARLTLAGDKDASVALDNRLEEILPCWTCHWAKNAQWRPDLANAAKQRIRNRLSRYNPDRASFRTWAYKVGHRAVMNEVRNLHLKEKQVSLEVLGEDTFIFGADPAQLYANTRVKEEVAKLPEEQATIIRMKFEQMLSIDAIARKLHLSRKQVRLRLQKAMVTLRQRLAYAVSTSHGPVS